MFKVGAAQAETQKMFWIEKAARTGGSKKGRSYS